MNKPASSILDHPAVSGHYLFPQSRFIKDPFVVDVGAAELACYRRIIDLNNFTIIHFHGNGESVSDYVPEMADMFEELGLNSLFIEQPASCLLKAAFPLKQGHTITMGVQFRDESRLRLAEFMERHCRMPVWKRDPFRIH